MAATTRPGRLRGLRQLLDFLDAHPRLPVPAAVTGTVHADNDLDGFELVARAAHVMGVAPITTVLGVQRAEQKFGPITYAIEYHPQRAAVTR
jgi:flagellar motor component MotA